MSHEDKARDALLDAAKREWPHISRVGRDYAEAHKAVVEATDLVDVMQKMVPLILAVEDLKEFAAVAEGRLRSVLADQMNETGATTILGAYLSKKPAFVSVDQSELIPQDYYTTPEPARDMKKIREALKAGELVPGCTLVRPNSMQLNIQRKKV